MKPRDLRDLRPQRGWKPTLLSVQSGAVTTVIGDHGAYEHIYADGTRDSRRHDRFAP
jgi:hypothetical protein